MILLRRKRRTTRLSIMLWALLISFVCGAIELGEPLEDLYRGGRNLVRARPADGKVVVVGLDDKTFDAMGKIYFSREHDAKVIDNLFAMGAKRVFFDRTYSGLTDEQGDAAFESALRRHPNKVYLGAITSIAGFTGKKSEIVPHPRYRTIASTATLNAHATPFGLSMDIRYADLFGNQSVRSISAEIADITKRPGSLYRPDWSIQASTIPTYSFIDIENGTAKRSQIEGRDVIVGPTADRLHDFARIAGQGWIPGVYFHAVGAQTLREGTPRDLGWLVAWAIAGLFALALLKARDGRRSRAITWGFVTLAIIAPFVFDWAFIKSDFLPAYLLFGIVRFRWKNLSDINLAERTNAGTMLPNLASLHEVEEASQRPVIALRIRNYAAIRASFRDSIGDELVSELARRLDLPGEKTTFYQAEDVLYWLAPRISRQELNSHLEGLARLAEAHLELRG
ncbi:MAG: CHASE2 domain-containing protein, partial [Betaproteobacteria bacterium]|nr:CHASE2 domain-containing protein [Betaproteobacteria bacterium]